MMKSLAGIEDRKCFIVNLAAGEENAAVESVRKLLNHHFIIDTRSASKEMLSWSLEKMIVDLETKLGRDGRESGTLWLQKEGGPFD